MVWVAIVIFAFFNLIFWSLLKKRPLMDWRVSEKILFGLFVLAMAIDIFQTYIAIYVLKVAVEGNPVFGIYPSIIAVVIFKLLLITMLAIFLRLLIVEKNLFWRTFLLWMANIFYWTFVILTAIQLCCYL